MDNISIFVIEEAPKYESPPSYSEAIEMSNMRNDNNLNSKVANSQDSPMSAVST